MRYPLRAAPLALLVALLALCPYASASAQGGPPRPYVAAGACPFECCRYGAWTATEATLVYAAERDRSRALFELPPGERFEAVTGNVHLDRPGVVVLARPLQAHGEGTHPVLQPGGTLHVLDYVGEGFYHIWHGGAVLQASAAWARPDEFDSEDEGHRGVLLVEPAMEWWVAVRTEGGRTGWIWMGEVDVEGADACE